MLVRITKRAGGEMADESAIKSYRYLRIGIVGVVGLLGASISFERAKVDCWQTSISAYYYTPVRSIFVGGLLAIGLCLIVIKGSNAWEDTCLNIAGMLAPVVALVPTSDAGNCWSVQPIPLPIEGDGSLAGWVVSNVNNNVKSLLVAGIAGLLIAAAVATVVTRNAAAVATVGAAGTRLALLGAMVLLVLGLVGFNAWNHFDTDSHFVAAIAMFVFLAGAVGGNAWEHRDGARRSYFWPYLTIVVLMATAAIVLVLVSSGWRHVQLFLEGAEITLFAAFWLVQTKEHWNEVN
jgi:hypothetical protein